MEDMNIDMDLPRVLITSYNSEKAGEIAIKMGAKYLSQESDTKLYLLNIDNKYYTAQILLCTIDSLLFDPSNYEALIFHYDLKTEDSLHLMNEQILPIVSQSEADIFLLVCDSISNTSLKEKVIEWCAVKKFELIELEYLDPKDIMDFGEDQSKYGIERINEVLETHMWPNINLKDSRKSNQNCQSEVNEVGDLLEDLQLANTINLEDRLQMENLLLFNFANGIINNEETDFAELFSHLREMKEQTASMAPNQRKIAAEQIVSAFWKAIGSPSEIDDE